MRRACLRIVSFLVSLVVVAATHSAPAPKSKIWVNHELDFEKFLETADVIAVEDIGSGVNNPKKVTLKKGDRTLYGVWKPVTRGRHDWAWESYQAEVAAWEMDKILGLGMVPPTVVRIVNGEKGSLQLWVEGCRLYEDIANQVGPSPKWEQELSRMKIFDCLICNRDRNLRNFMVDAAWNIILIDHSQAFMSHKNLEDDPKKLPELFDKRLVKELKALDLERLQLKFDRLLLDTEIQSIMTRRDELLAHMEKLIIEKGEDAVLR